MDTGGLSITRRITSLYGHGHCRSSPYKFLFFSTVMWWDGDTATWPGSGCVLFGRKSLQMALLSAPASMWMLRLFVLFCSHSSIQYVRHSSSRIRPVLEQQDGVEPRKRSYGSTSDDDNNSTKTVSLKLRAQLESHVQQHFSTQACFLHGVCYSGVWDINLPLGKLLRSIRDRLIIKTEYLLKWGCSYVQWCEESLQGRKRGSSVRNVAWVKVII